MEKAVMKYSKPFLEASSRVFSVVFAIVVVSGAKWGVGVGEGNSALPIVTSSLS